MPENIFDISQLVGESDDLTITVFSKNQCNYCNVVKRAFGKRDIPFTEINVEVDTEVKPEFGNITAFDYVVNNFSRQMPTVTVTDTQGNLQWFSGMSMSAIEQIYKRFAV